jgi:hypothetical protein
MATSPFDDGTNSDTANSGATLVGPAASWVSPPPGATWRDSQTLPPLRIHHLLVMTVVVAVAMTVVRLVVPLDRIADGNRAGMLLPLLYAVLYSIGFCCFLFAARWRYRGLNAFAQPGQWLLLIYPLTVAYLLVLLLISLAEPLFRSSFGILPYVLLTTVPAVIGPLVFYSYALWRIADTSWWRLFFGLKIAGGLFQLLQVLDGLILGLNLLSPILAGGSIFAAVLIRSIVPGLIMIVALSAAIISDARAHPRHWSAWFGAGLLAVTQFANVIQGVFVLMSQG